MSRRDDVRRLFRDPTLRARLIQCARREVGFRERAYPNWVTAGRMTQAKADEELTLMREIVRELERG